MSFRIYTNLEALNAQRHLGALGNDFAKSVRRLSSGLRIGQAADDAAGLAIAERLRAQVNGLGQARRNTQDAISMVQTAEGAMTEIQAMIQRVRELSVEAANSTLGSDDVAAIAAEMGELRAEIDRIAASSRFNGQSLLDGSFSVSQDTGAAGSLLVGRALNTGHTAVIAAIDVSGATANTTYTLTSTTPGQLTLANGAGVSQTLTLAAIGASGTEVIDFDSLRVRVTVIGDAAKTGMELAADLAAGSGPAGIGGTAGSNLVDGANLFTTSTSPMAGAGATYSPSGLDGSIPFTAVVSPGVGPGSFQVTADGATGALTATLNGETFSGSMAGIIDGAHSSSVLVGDHGHRISIDYLQAAAGATRAAEATDISSATFTVTSGPNAATVSMLTAPAATPGTYTITSAAPNTLTLTGPGGSQTIAVAGMASSSVQTLDFNTLGISFRLTSNTDPTGMLASDLIADLTGAQLDTIVVTPGNVPPVIATGPGQNAGFQVGPDAVNSLAVPFGDVRTSASGYGTFASDIAALGAAAGGSGSTTTAAKALITSSDVALGYLSRCRGHLGAVQNRLEHISANLSIASENLEGSASRIRDLDVAAEMVAFARLQILQQVASSVLAQANQAPNVVLQLLK